MIFYYQLRFLSLTVLCALFINVSAAYAVQQQRTIFTKVSEHTLYNDSAIDKEILAGETNLSFHRQNNAAIVISWSQVNYRQLAWDVRNELLNTGVPASAIHMQSQSVANNAFLPGLVHVVVEHYHISLHTCNYHRQDYQYRDRDKMGCALDNMRRLSAVN